MFVNIFLMLIFVLCLAYVALSFKRIEADLSVTRRDFNRLQHQQAELRGAVRTVEEMTQAEEETLAGLMLELKATKGKKETLEAELQAALDAPKQRIFVFDKTTLIHGKLWDVRIANDGTAGAGSPTGAEWAAGRACLVGSATERDARHRAESRFPSSQGYRIMSIERFRRA